MTIAPKPPEDAAVAGISQSKAKAGSKLKPEAMNEARAGSQKTAGPGRAGGGFPAFHHNGLAWPRGG